MQKWVFVLREQWEYFATTFFRIVFIWSLKLTFVFPDAQILYQVEPLTELSLQEQRVTCTSGLSCKADFFEFVRVDRYVPLLL